MEYIFRTYKHNISTLVSARLFFAFPYPISGTGFAFDASSRKRRSATTDNVILIGGAPCVVISSTETEIKCTLGESPGGAHDTVITVNGKGYSIILHFFCII